MTETQATKPEAPSRLEFHSWRPFAPGDSMTCYVSVRERLSKKRSVTFAYGVREVAPPPGGARVFQFFKEGDATPRELRVYPAGWRCTCPAGKYRPGQPCRHLEAVQHLTEKGYV